MKSSCVDHILAKLIQAGGKTLSSEISNPINSTVFGIRNNCQSSGRNVLLYQFIKSVVKLILIII
jgi:hypothetical protein